MKNVLFTITLLTSIFIVSCKDDEATTEEVVAKPLTFCDCTTPVDSLITKCSELFPLPKTTQDSLTYIADYMACTGVNPFEMQKVGDNAEALKAYENDLSLEIKELPEEELNPISDECKELLEEYADAIKSFSKLLNKIEKNPEDINLLIARGEEEENLYSYSSKPLTFQCSTNPNFKKQVEILNGKRDKLISN
jgi:tetratricopeptide (TPR) repeat protein